MKKISKDKLYEVDKVSNFRELIDRSYKLYPNKTAFIYKKNPKDTTYISHTYTDLKEDISSLGTALIDLGLQNKRIAIIAPNRYEWCISYLAVTTSRNDCCSTR